MHARSGSARCVWGLAAAVLLTSCGGDDEEQSGGLRTLTLNMYIGFGEDVLNGDLTEPAELAAALQLALETFRQTDSPGRIRGMGRFLADEEPDVVGLQEVISIVLTRGTADTSDDVAFVDYLGDLLDETRSAGGPSYQRFVHVNNVLEGDIDLLGRLEPFRFEESDVLLVHPDHAAQAVGTGLSFRSLLPIGPVVGPGGQVVERFFIRGAHHVRVTREGQSFEVFNTHLEVNGPGGIGTGIQNAQARELLAYIAAQTAASAAGVVVIGDMNGEPGSVTHGILTAGGLQDTFAAAGQGAGLSCCQAPRLDNTANQAVERIDYVFCKGGQSACQPVSSEVVLNARVARSDGPGQVWTSDHFGVLSELEFP